MCSERVLCRSHIALKKKLLPKVFHRFFYLTLYSFFLEGEEWWDLCAGPHVESTGNINKKAVELESIAGAYWRGDERKPMLQRIYGTAWENEEQLKAYLHFKEEAKRRDHRRLGQDLDLFSIQVQLKVPSVLFCELIFYFDCIYESDELAFLLLFLILWVHNC